MGYTQTETSSSSEGFTVVEVIVALVLFSMVAVMLVSITEYVQYSQRQSIYIGIASRAAQDKITEYQEAEYDSFDVGDDENFSSQVIAGGLPPGSTALVEISDTSVSSTYSKEIEVTITYPASSTTKTVKMKAYISDGGSI